MNGTDLYFLAEWTEHMIYEYSNDYKFTIRKNNWPTDQLTKPQASVNIPRKK